MKPLRKKMSEDMEIRNLSPRTRKVYLYNVALFARHFGKSPDLLGPNEIRAYQIYLLHERNLSWSYYVQCICALRFFYRVTLEKDWIVRHLPFPRKEKRLPEILSMEELSHLFRVVRGSKYRAILMTMYGAGLRVSEVVSLRVEDIDSRRNVIWIRQGKGRKDRCAMLSPALLSVLRAYWREKRPTGWLFPGRRPDEHIHVRMVQRTCNIARREAHIEKRVSPQILRHCFATHLLEDGTDIRIIQALLGHRSIRTTTRYTHVSNETISATRSPLDKLFDRNRI